MGSQAPNAQTLLEMFKQSKQELKDVKNALREIEILLLNFLKKEEPESAPLLEMELQSGSFKMDGSATEQEFVTDEGGLQNESLSSLIFVVAPFVENFTFKTGESGEHLFPDGIILFLELYCLNPRIKFESFFLVGKVLLIYREWKRRRKKEEGECLSKEMLDT